MIDIQDIMRRRVNEADKKFCEVSKKLKNSELDPVTRESLEKERAYLCEFIMNNAYRVDKKTGRYIRIY